MKSVFGYPCPECGEWSAVVREAGRDELGRRVRRRNCVPCGLNFATVEVIVPVSYFRMAESKYPVIAEVKVA